MGLLGYLKKYTGKENVLLKEEDLEKIKSVIDVCDASECADACGDFDEKEVEGDTNIFSKLKIDQEEPLFGSMKEIKVHFIVPTSQTDWPHDACTEKPGSVQYEIDEWIQKNKTSLQEKGLPEQAMRCSVSSMPIDLLDLQVMKNEKNDVVILPHFVRMKNILSKDVAHIMEEIVPLLIENDRKALLEKPYIEEANEDSFIFLCSHKTRDKRCGVTAPILEKLINRRLQHHKLYRDNSDFRPKGSRVAFVNHVGGHKFAANVLIYLKKSSKMVWLGRVTPMHTSLIVDSIVVPDSPKLPFPEKVRCVAKYKF